MRIYTARAMVSAIMKYNALKEKALAIEDQLERFRFLKKEMDNLSISEARIIGFTCAAKECNIHLEPEMLMKKEDGIHV